MDTPYQAST